MTVQITAGATHISRSEIWDNSSGSDQQVYSHYGRKVLYRIQLTAVGGAESSATATGLTLPAGFMVEDIQVISTVAESGVLIDVGPTADPNGYIDGLDIGTATGITYPVLANAAETVGALLKETSSGGPVRMHDITGAGTAIVYQDGQGSPANWTTQLCEIWIWGIDFTDALP